jgi:ribosome-binding factor A
MKKNHSLERIKEERKKSRADRISSLIKKTIAEILIQIDFSDSLGNNILIFVSNVILSSDGKNATVFLETINYTGGIDKDILETINEKTSKIKKEFSSRIDLRYTPKLKFKVTSTHN